MAIKNKNDNGLAILLHYVWVFGIVLAFTSLFGWFMVAIVFGVAMPLLLDLLTVGVLVGIGLFMFLNFYFWALLPFPRG